MLTAHLEACNRAVFGHLKFIAEQRRPTELLHERLGKLGKRVRDDDYLGKLTQLVQELLCTRHGVDGGNNILNLFQPQTMFFEDADSIAVTFVADSLRVDDTDKEGVYNLSYGNGVAVTVRMDGDGRMMVLDSRGLFAYPKEKEQFAR